jgi:hypothetical protein
MSDGLPPEHAKRLRKIHAEWCNEDEGSFPFSQPMTLAQWRAAATVPRSVLVARNLATNIYEQRHIIGLVKASTK